MIGQLLLPRVPRPAADVVRNGFDSVRLPCDSSAMRSFVLFPCFAEHARRMLFTLLYLPGMYTRSPHRIRETPCRGGIIKRACVCNGPSLAGLGTVKLMLFITVT